jgi:Na+-driven multidrug efflux pump
MEPIRSINILGGIALKTVGDGKFSVILSLVFMWGLVPVVFLSSALGFGIVGVWACLLLDETIRACVNYWRWKSGRWIGKTVINKTKD